MPKVDRLTRVNELIRREIAMILEKYPVSPAGVLVSVTEVRCSVDLRNATVALSVYGGKDASVKGLVLQNARKFRADIQDMLAGSLAFKNTPVLNFELDERIEKGDAIFTLLQQEPDESN